MRDTHQTTYLMQFPEQVILKESFHVAVQKDLAEPQLEWVTGGRLIAARKLELHSGVCKQSDCRETRRAAASFSAI